MTKSEERAAKKREAKRLNAIRHANIDTLRDQRDREVKRVWDGWQARIDAEKRKRRVTA